LRAALALFLVGPVARWRLRPGFDATFRRMDTRQDLQGKHVVLGLSGGIACYKAAELTRVLVKAGATVQVVMTEGAAAFITAVTLQALSGRPVYTSP
jgi:hypothetical protein